MRPRTNWKLKSTEHGPLFTQVVTRALPIWVLRRTRSIRIAFRRSTRWALLRCQTRFPPRHSARFQWHRHCLLPMVQLRQVHLILVGTRLPGQLPISWKFKLPERGQPFTQEAIRALPIPDCKTTLPTITEFLQRMTLEPRRFQARFPARRKINNSVSLASWGNHDFVVKYLA